MSSRPAVSNSSHGAVKPAGNPLKNPSYPARTHFGERPSLEARLKACDEKLAGTRRKLALVTNHPRHGDFAKLIHQMQGARDQIADAVYRMPRETGGLYHEDEERLAIAERSFDFLLRRWDVVSAS